ncbi:MAG: MFS transporter [Acidobacteriota bacterium]|nr:MFS transporter [Acidobacteriota bacterium]
MLALIAVAMVASMGPWFAASASSAAIEREFGLSVTEGAWLTMMVQFGFVAGTLIIAATGAADVIRAPVLMSAGGLVAATATAALAFTGTPALLLILRFAAGAGMACVYPPGMKLAASWFRVRRGTALGVIVGSLAIGKAVPYLLAALTSEWRVQVLILSGGTVAGMVLIAGFAREGPFAGAAARLDPRAIAGVIRQRETRLATLAYLGHMWELYAVWTWFGAFAAAGFLAAGHGAPAQAGSIAGFITIAAGAAGAIVAGHWADRYGRVRVAAASLVVSGACCLTAGLFFGAPPWVIYLLAAVWGFSVVSDSAQFSALVTEHSPRAHVGTALTLQTSAGFLLTTIPMRWLPSLATDWGWQWVFVILLPGPMLGLAALARLRTSNPECRTSNVL